mgnify:CR=1 FL=1|tara:strand:+ start:1005 stop:1394 length:390 start_codon:yes stop_codon:yes gene_type:complete
MNYKERLKLIFDDVIGSPEFDELKISKHFDKDYQQWVDGHELDYCGFIEHMRIQKQRVKSVDIKFHSIIEEGQKVSTIHFVNATTKDGHEVEGRVIAHFTFNKDKLILCEELTFFNKARDEDRDLGHIR